MSAAGLVAETSLAALARRLRVLGYDVEIVPGARLEALFDAARATGRVPLTTSARRPGRDASVPALTVPREDLAGGVRAVAEAFAPSSPPFSRCTLCNGALERRAAGEARDHVPTEALARGAPFHRCAACGRWFWHGSHVDRLRAWLEEVLGVAVPGPSSGEVLGLGPEPGRGI